MKNLLAPAILGLALTGCVSTGMWSEAPGDDYYGNSGYTDRGAPVGWWGSNAASVNVFYGALAGYGRWDSYPGYGRVFIPAGVGPGWQPYSRGYWVTDPRYGRRWVSSEPFGWATYHYGRWGRDSRLGWFWVPDTRFGASWVDWHRSGGYDSWAPLPPFGWDRHARRGYGWGNDWWLHAPSSYAWRPGMQQHVRRGRPDSDIDRPGIDRPAIGQSGPYQPRPGVERPRGDDVVDGRHPRSDGRQRENRQQDGWQQNNGQRDDGQRESRSQQGFEREVRQPRNAPEAARTRPMGQQGRVDEIRTAPVRAEAPVEAVQQAPAQSAPTQAQAPAQAQAQGARKRPASNAPREPGQAPQERSD